MSVAVHHRLDGSPDRPVLVLAGSLGSTLEMWDDQVAARSEHVRVLRYDQRGHGRSPVPPGPYSIADLGGDVVALLDGLDVVRASFCGLSIGGMTGLWLGAHAPERIDRLVLSSTAPRLPPAEQWTERAATVRAQGVAAVAEATLGRWFTPAFHESRPATIERFHRMLIDAPAEGYASGCEAIAKLDLRNELGAILGPTLVIAGADDPVAPPERSRLLAEAIPGARLTVVPEARHLAKIEQPEAFTQALLDHLDAEVPA